MLVDAVSIALTEGCGAVLLKLKNDDDSCVNIIASSVNQDGRTAHLTAPSAASQEELLRDAIARASINPGEIDFVETHCTGLLHLIISI